MYIYSILLFIFLIIIKFNYIFCLWKGSKDSLENYTIDVLFTNSLTILRCNIYEVHVFRDINIESIGHIKCSNKHLFLPDDHIESITLLQWDYTIVNCTKKKDKIKEEKTYLTIKHKAKHAFKKLKFDLVRVGSLGPSKLHMDEKKPQLYFQHEPRKLELINNEPTEDGLSTDIYSFKNRPIICRERQYLPDGLCSNYTQYQNLSYVCYYKIGVPEPPTVAEMENELNILSKKIDFDGNTKLDSYINETPIKKSSRKKLFIIGIVVFIIIIIIIGIIILFCYCGSGKDKAKSDTSFVSNMS